MNINAEKSELKQLDIGLIDRNPDNPRVLFRQDELDELLESIRRYGVQVPISVFKDGKRYVLIDGERRWRCSLKLNKQTIPALVQEKPTALNNLLLMFNIHSLREQWDLLTMALKLPKVIQLIKEKENIDPNEKELSERTGLQRSIIRRCKLLMELPQQYKDEILDELKKPKNKQIITEDLFIEMERALKTVERAMPDVIDNKDRIRRILIDKYKNDIITNITHFRQMGKIARAGFVDADIGKARKSLNNLFKDNNYSIESAFHESVYGIYFEKDLEQRITKITEILNSIDSEEIDKDLRKALKELVYKINNILEEV